MGAQRTTFRSRIKKIYHVYINRQGEWNTMFALDYAIIYIGNRGEMLRRFFLANFLGDIWAYVRILTVDFPPQLLNNSTSKYKKQS